MAKESEVKTEAEAEAEVKAIVTGILIIAATSSFFVSPLLPFFHAEYLSIAGILAGLGAGIFWMQTHSSGRNWAVWLGAAFCFFGLSVVIFIHFQAVSDYRANLKRCAKIQHRMLDGRPDASDLPALFTALDCSPHGEEPLKLPAESRKMPGNDAGTTLPG